MRQKGITQVLVLVILVILVAVASVSSYYILKSWGRAPVGGIVPVTYFTPTPTPTGISDSDDPSVIEAEFDSTTLDAFDSEIDSLETSASSL
jgi:hypothetical protein